MVYRGQWTSRVCLTLLVVVLVVAPSVGLVTTTGAVAQQTQPDTDNTVTRIEVSPDGDGRWTIQIRTRLDTEARVSEYEAFQTRFRNDTAQYLDPFRTRMRGVVANAANATGREMRVTNVTASTTIQEVPRRWGVVSYSFTWTNLADRANGSLVLGDVFQGGFYIAANDTLAVTSPDGYRIADVEPVPASRTNRTVTWLGREDFADERPRVAFVPSSAQTGADEGDSDATGSGATPLDDLAQVALLGLLGLGLVGGGAYAAYRRRRDAESPDVTSSPVDDGDADASDGAAARQPARSSDGTPTGETPETGPTQPAETEQPLATDEERVLALLESNGGRMRQAAIDEAFDWSTSKTSRLVGTLEAEGAVEKLQLGRENLIDRVDDE